MSDYKSISVKNAIDNIKSDKYLLPAIQRRFVWNREQIEMLFDSILSGYPISSFMLWKINNKKNKYEYNYYPFIRNYVERFGETTKNVENNLLDKNFYAVIDGQQRLTSFISCLV